ncbi:hypothetical protein [Lewinella sp. IMCC34183]|uniref:hypothetical protein n=1 Tax=Lewinella sp. IMCC34183 TaxID=2248762 RepID=UPI001300708D|nr:hypothetical protein [Lewinella sp. IMCC34183]
MKWIPQLLLFLFAALASVPVLAQPPHVQRMHHERDLQKAQDERYREQRKADHERYREQRKARHKARKNRRKSGHKAAPHDRYHTREPYPTRPAPRTGPQERGRTSPRREDRRIPDHRPLPASSLHHRSAR